MDFKCWHLDSTKCFSRFKTQSNEFGWFLISLELSETVSDSCKTINISQCSVLSVPALMLLKHSKTVASPRMNAIIVICLHFQVNDFGMKSLETRIRFGSRRADRQ